MYLTGKKKHAVLLMLMILIGFSMILMAGEHAHAVSVEWGKFQNSQDNNGVTDRETPETYNEAALKWGKQLVQGYTTSFTPPLIINGEIYTASNQRVYRIDKATGDILKESEKMQIDVSYAMHPMTYSEEEDALYLPLLNGRVQCIDRSTLALKWISRAYNGTQALSPITYKNGYVYTGIWGSELTDGAYFCLNAKTGKTVWEMRPSELETVTKAEKLPDFAKPTGQSKPDNFYTYTAVITISAKDGYKFIDDGTGRCWLADSSGAEVIPEGYTKNTIVPATANGRAAGFEYVDSGSAVMRVKFNCYGGAFTQQGGEQESSVKLTGLDTPAAGSTLDSSASVSDHLTVKSIEWKKGDIPHGFYWAGCYANDKYVVFGSDDGQNNTFGAAGDSSYTETSTLYCLNRSTGEIVDKLEGLKGDIRSTIVHHNGYLYFTSKGGVLYKVRLGSDGKFSDKSLFDTGAMMTASPVVHNGRIYVGVCGMAGQFNADGGHKFCVFRDDEKLTGEAKYEERYVGINKVNVLIGGNGSYLYSVDIAGYPQASPILSTYGEGSNGKVRLYFTFNAFPGGIYYLEDTQTSVKENHSEARLLFRPETGMEQYCISPIAVDSEGTLYIKNDSGYMMAVSRNKAYLNDIKVYAGDNEVEWNIDFRPGTLNYVLTAPDGYNSVDYVLDVPSGQTATVNGTKYTSGKFKVNIGEDAAATTVTVSRTVGTKVYTRSYTMNMKTASNNANLAGIAINDSNSAPNYIIDEGDNHSNSIGIGFDPVFDASTTKYVSRTYTGRKEFVNVWVAKADPNATVKVYPVSYVGNDLVYFNEDGTLPDKGSSGKSRYPVYWVKGEISAEVRIEVTSASGKVKQTYNVELVRSKDNLDVGKEPLVLDPPSVTLYTTGGIKTVQAKATMKGVDVTGECTWYSSRPSKVTVDSNGVISSQGEEVAEDNPVSVWAKYGAQSRPISVVVLRPPCEAPRASLVSGSYRSRRNVTLSTTTPGAKIYYTVGDPSKEDISKPTASSTLYTGPIAIGENGVRRKYRIRAIAVADGYSTSASSDFDYTIDLAPAVPEVTLNGLNKPKAGQPLDMEVTSGTQNVTAGAVEWFKISDDGTETPVTGTAEEGAGYRAKIALGVSTDSISFDESTLAKVDGAYKAFMLTDGENATVVCDYRTDNKVPLISLVGMKAPSGNEKFFYNVYSATDGASVRGIVWKKADGSAAPAKPEYYTDYAAEITVAVADGYEPAETVKALVNYSGVQDDAEITANADGTYTVKILMKSTKFILDTSAGNGLTVSPTEIAGLQNGITVDGIREKLASCSVTAKSESGQTVALDKSAVFWDEEYIKERYDLNDLKPAPFGAVGKVTLPEYMDDNGSNREVAVSVSVSPWIVSDPEFSPAPGKYVGPQKVTMKSATPGAAVFYTMSGSDETLAYEEPVLVEGESGKVVSVEFNAYAMAQGIKSKTVSYTITIDRTNENADAEKHSVNGKTPDETAAAGAAVSKKIGQVKDIAFTGKLKKKTITISFAKAKGAVNYRVEYRKAGAKSWKHLWTGGKTKATIKKLKKGAMYQYRISAFAIEDGYWKRGSWSKVQYQYFNTTTAKFKAAKKSVIASPKKVKKVTGYQVRYSLKKTMKGAKAKTFKGWKKTNLKVKKLKSKKKYFVQACPYKKYKGKTYVGLWTKAKKIKVK